MNRYHVLQPGVRLGGEEAQRMTCAIIFSILTLAGEQRGRVMSTYDRPPSRERKRACSCFGAGRAGRAGSAAGREREAKGMLRNPRAGQVQKRCPSTMRAFAFICDVMLRNDTGGDEEEQPASGVLSIFSIALQVLPSWCIVCTSFATVTDRPNGECAGRGVHRICLLDVHALRLACQGGQGTISLR